MEKRNLTKEEMDILAILNEKDSNFLAPLAFSALEKSVHEIGFMSGTPLERIAFWSNNNFKNICKNAGELGQELLTILNDDTARSDIILASILLSKVPSILGYPTVPFEEMAALILLIIRYAK